MGPIRLDLSRSFLGRREELAILLDAYKTSWQDDMPCTVFIEGASGTGKTALVEEFYARTKSVSYAEGGSFFGRGKFEEARSATEPFVAIADAVRQIVRGMMQSPEMDQWKELLRVNMRGEGRFLETLLPVDELFGVEDAGANWEMPFDNGRIHFDRLCLAFRQLLREFSSRGSPVVMFLDDLQWAGRDSLALIETILQDESRRKFLLVVAHRPVQADHPLTALKPKAAGVRDITLGNLSLGDVAGLLGRVLSQEEEDVTPLADVLLQKTGGNALFLKQFLLSLEKRGLVWYSVKLYRWRWDLPSIQTDTDVSSNVVNLVYSKLHDAKFSIALMMAALLGSTVIDVEMLLCIVADQGLSRDELRLQLEEAKSEGLLEDLSESSEHDYKFSHDRILESALSLLPTGRERVELHLRIGRLLRRQLAIVESGKGEGGKTWNSKRLLFHTVTQMNAGSTLLANDAEVQDLARLNFQAGAEAIDPWNYNFELATQVSVALSRVEYCCGRLQESIHVADTVLANARSFEDRNAVAHTKILCLTQQQKKSEAIDMTISMLSELGVKFPRRCVKLHLARQFFRTKKLMAGRSDQELLNLPFAEDERAVFASEYLLRLGEIALSWGLEELLALSMLIGTELTMTKGRFGMTAMTFQAWGFILASEGSFEEAHRFGKLGLQMATERRGGSLDDRTVLLYYLWIFHWKCPYVQGVKASSKALERLWECGAVENVLLDTNTYLRIYFCSGLQLRPLKRDIKHYAELCRDYQQEVMLNINLPFFQMVSNLMGHSNNTVDLTGEFMDQEEYVRTWKKSNSAALQMLYFHRMMAAYFFNDYRLAGQMSDKVTQMQVEGPETWVPYRYFFKGLTSWSLAKETGRCMYIKKGNAVMKLLKKWVQQGVVNCNHMLLILQAARLSALSTESDRVKQAFDTAISATAKIGVLHDKALVNELAGMYFLNSDKYVAEMYIRRARDCYAEWGADGKVQQMDQKHEHLLSKCPSSSAAFRKSSVLHAKTRVAKMLSRPNINRVDMSTHGALCFKRQRRSSALSFDDSFD